MIPQKYNGQVTSKKDQLDQTQRDRFLNNKRHRIYAYFYKTHKMILVF